MRIVGDMGIAASHDPELERALTFLGCNFTKTVAMALGRSHSAIVQSCVPTAATLEMFLQKIGFDCAKAIPVDATLHRPYSGLPSFSDPQGGVKAVYASGQRVRSTGFPGHFVVTAANTLIDPTLAQFRRNWCPALPDQMALPLRAPGEFPVLEGLPALLAEYGNPNDHWRIVYEIWPGPQQTARHARNALNRSNQSKSLAALLRCWQTWHGQAVKDGGAGPIN